jgi:phage terminase large subunit-like protein
MMVSIHGPDDSEFDFRTAMNIWGKLRKRHILIEKAKESTEKSKLLKITRERIKRDMLKIK